MAHAGGRLLAPRQQQRRAAEHPPLAPALPGAADSGAVAGGGPVEAHRVRRPRWLEQRGGDRRVDHRARIDAARRAPRRQRLDQVG
jgi:hypothetical protein